MKEVSFALDLSSSTIRRMVKESRFPKPTYVGGSPRWDVDDVRAWKRIKSMGITVENEEPAAQKKPK